MSHLRRAILLLTLSAAAFAAPAAEVQLSTNAKGQQVVTHEGRAFALTYEADMERFAKLDAADPATGGIVFTGSSTFTGWTSVSKDMAPLPVVNRAFGGSATPQIWWYADRALFPRQPRLIVVYSGDNDLYQPSVTVENYLKYIHLLLDRVWENDPKTRLIFVSTKPSPSRWQHWEKFQTGNATLRDICAADERLTYVDISATLLDANGQVQPECFQADMLHMKPEMYVEWTKVIKPVVERVWEDIQKEQ